ncbi:MAG TPA: hypothetical protein PLF48_04700 [Chitinophagales bacterium]|nr:hypothetical protein [Chitinophagales bacterium]
MGKFFKYVFRTLLILCAILLISFITLYYLIQQPKYQTLAVRKVSEILSKQLGSEVKVDSVNLKFISTIQIHKVYLSEKNKPNDTILFINRLDASLMLGKTLMEQISSLQSAKYYVDDVNIDGLKFHGYRGLNDSIYNFQFLLDNFKSKNNKPTPKKAKKPIELRLNELTLTNGNLVLDDIYKDQRFDIRYTKVDINVRQLDINHLKIDAKKVVLEDPYFCMTDYNNIPSKPKIKKPTLGFKIQELGNKLNINVDKLTLVNGQHRLDFQHKDQKAGNFLISQMNIQNIVLNMDNYVWDSTGMTGKLTNLSANADNQIKLKNLSGLIHLDNGGIYLDNADLALNNSILKGNLSLQFLTGHWNSLSNFQDEVMLKADLKETKTNGHDVALFAPKVQKYIPPNTRLEGLIRGRLSNLKVENLKLTAADNTVIDISGNIKGLPKIQQTLFDLNIHQLKTNASELKQILTFVKLPKQLDNAGNISFKGSYFGFINDFVAKGNLTTTNLGNLTTDLRMRFPKGKSPEYSGNVTANGLNLAELTGNKKLLGTVDLDIAANGKGFNAKELSTDLKGTIRNFYLNGFVFDKILVDGFLDKKKFKGKAFFDDKCFLVDFNGMVDFNNELPKFDFTTSIKNADLNKLHLTKDTLLVSLDGEVHGSGKSLDNLIAAGNFSNMMIQNQKDILVLSDVAMNVKNSPTFRDYNIISDQFNAHVNGNFNPLNIVPSMKVFLSQYSKLIKPTAKDLKLAKPQQLNADIKLKSDFGIFKVFVPKVKYLSEVEIKSNINTTDKKLTLTANLDSAVYDKLVMNKIILDAETRENNLVADIVLDKLQSGKTIVNDIGVNLTSSAENLLTNISISNDTAKNSVRLTSSLDFRGDSVIAKILDSKLKLNNKIWTVAPNNQLTIVDSIFLTQNIILLQDDQKISIINGRNSLEDAKINIENLNLTDIVQLVDTSHILQNGFLSGNVSLKNILTKPLVNADLNINELQVAGYKVKIVGLSGIYGRDGKSIVEVNGTLDDKDYQLAFDGTYDMQIKGKEKFDVTADIEKLNISFLETILKKELLVPRAFVKGQVNVSGNLKNPILNGTAEIIDTAELKFRMLGTTFKLYKEKIKLTREGFDFGEMTVYDNFGNTALLSGKLTHTGFKNFGVENVVFSAPIQYNFMNTTYEDNQDFYGKVFAKGDVFMNGSFNDLSIKIPDLTTLKNSEFNLPVSDKAADKGYAWIKFIDPKDTSKRVAYKTKLSGINIDLNVNATKDAVVNLILDPSSNDKITGRGYGNINVVMDKAGNFNIYNTYYLTEGKYDFTFQGILNKTFVIKDGSKIIFNGKPDDAELDIKALYNVKSASVRNLFDTITQDERNIRTKSFPIDLNLNITGSLKKTKVSFDISATPGTASANSDLLGRKLAEISNNENDVNNNAATLLLFNSFFPTGTSSDQRFSGASSSVTDLLLGQISNLISQGLGKLIKGASLDLVLNELETQERNFGFTYKQELIGGRLILTIGGNVNFGNSSTINATSLSQQNSNNAIAGDFMIEYLVTTDGRIRLKAYGKASNYDIFGQDRFRTGGAISFQKDFDDFRDLFKIQNKRNKPIPVLDSLPPAPPPADTGKLKETANIK